VFDPLRGAGERIMVRFAALLSVLALLAGCGGGNSNDTDNPGSPPTGGEQVPLTGTVGTGTTP